MMYEDVIRDFAERTRTNQRAIEHLLQDEQEVYEATQVVNSLLGLLVFPREKFFGRIPEKPLTELQEDGWPIPTVCNGFSQVTDLRQLVRFLRNAVAHFNIEFIGNGSEEIRLLRVWNKDPRTKKVTWKAELSLDDIRRIAERFTDLLLESDTQQTPDDRTTS